MSCPLEGIRCGFVRLEHDIAMERTDLAEKKRNSTRPIEREDLYRLAVVGDVDISADGKRIAYVVKRLDQEKDDYVSNIHVWHDGGTRQYTWSGKDSSPRWSPDGSKLAFLSGRDEHSQIFCLPTDGGEVVQLTSLDLGAGTPAWSPDSTCITFAAATPFPEKPQATESESKKPTKVIDRAVFKFDGSGFNHNRRSHIFLVQVESRAVRQLTDGDFNERSPAWSPEGQYLAFAANRRSDWDTRRRSDIWVIPSEGGEPRRVTQTDGVWSDPVFSPDGRRITYTGFATPTDAEPSYYSQLWITDRAGRSQSNVLEATGLDTGRSMVSDWSSAGERTLFWVDSAIYFLTTVRGRTQAFHWSEKGVSPITLGDHDVVSLSVAGDGSLTYAKSDATHPAEVFRCSKGVETQISNVNDETLQELHLSDPEPTSVRGADGEEVEGWIMKPIPFRTDQSYPVLLYIHGGPASAYGHTFFHELQWWAAQGYAVAFCNPHGSASYGEKFQNVIRHDWGNRDYQDIMTFTDEVAGLEWVDTNRMAAAGGSYGGYMVNWLAGHTDRFAAFCTQRSICNMVSQGGSSDLAAFRQERSGATPEGDPELLWKQSPLKFASRARTPTLILHQELDHRCPIEQGEQWFAALKRMGVPARFIRFPDESHGMSRTGKPSRRFERLGYMLEWFERYV